MNRKICFLIIGLLTIVMTACNKVDNNAVMEKADVKPQISTQAPIEVESENNKVDNNNNQRKSENPVGTKYKVVDEKYINKEITIKYPQITNLGDNRQKSINEILKAEALSVLGFYEGSNDVSLDISYRSKAADNKYKIAVPQ